MILTREHHAKHPFASRNTQHSHIRIVTVFTGEKLSEKQVKV